MEEKEIYTITEFAEMFRITRQTLIHYDKIGLFKPAKINDNGYRLYEHSQKPKMIEIMQLKDAGMSLSDIMEVMKKNNADSILALFDTQIAKLDDQILELQMKKLITHPEDVLSVAIWKIRIKQDLCQRGTGKNSLLRPF